MSGVRDDAAAVRLQGRLDSNVGIVTVTTPADYLTFRSACDHARGRIINRHGHKARIFQQQEVYEQAGQAHLARREQCP